MYGKRIKTLRKQKGMSQSDMAHKLHLAPATYSKIETNRTNLSVDVLQQISDLFEISPLAIMNGDSDVVNLIDSANNHGTINNCANAETAFNYQKAYFDNIINAKDSEITTLKKANENQQLLIQHQAAIIEKWINQ